MQSQTVEDRNYIKATKHLQKRQREREEAVRYSKVIVLVVIVIVNGEKGGEKGGCSQSHTMCDAISQSVSYICIFIVGS